MTPLRSLGKGSSHERRIALEEMGTVVKFVGGPVGTTIKEHK